MLCVLSLAAIAFAGACDPNAEILDAHTYVDGSCVYPDWEPYGCQTCTTADADVSESQAVRNWLICGPGSSAAMAEVRMEGLDYDQVIFWYGVDGEMLGLGRGGSGAYCCDGEMGEPVTHLTVGVPMQTCYAPIPFRFPEMERAGECYTPPGGCSTVGTSGAGGGLTLVLGLMLLWRRRDV